MGKPIVVGIGPENEENTPLGAQHAQKQCDVIVGYHVSMDLVKGRYPGNKKPSVCKEIQHFFERAYSRVLPMEASLHLCQEARLMPAHIFAIQAGGNAT